MPNRYPQAGTPHDEWFREGRVWHELEPRPGEMVIHKPSYGAFHDTPLRVLRKGFARVATGEEIAGWLEP